jgi:hypothetical protein
MQHNAPTRGAVGTESVDVSAVSVRGGTGAGKSDPSRARGTRVGDRDDPDGLRGSDGGVDARLGATGDEPPSDTRPSSTRGPDRTTGRSQRGRCSVGNCVDEAACPRRRRSGPLQLDVQPKPWHNRQDGLGVLEPEDVTRARRFSPGPHPQSLQPTRALVPASMPDRYGGGADASAKTALTSTPRR